MLATICGNGRTVYSAFAFMTAKNTESYERSLMMVMMSVMMMLETMVVMLTTPRWPHQLGRTNFSWIVAFGFLIVKPFCPRFWQIVQAQVNNVPPKVLLTGALLLSCISYKNHWKLMSNFTSTNFVVSMTIIFRSWACQRKRLCQCKCIYFHPKLSSTSSLLSDPGKPGVR